MSVPTLFCHDGNVAEFNAALREQPDIRAFFVALYKVGMIDGLRGATLAPVGTLPRGVQPVLSLEAENRIADIHYARSK